MSLPWATWLVPEVAMATRRSARAAVAAAVGFLLMAMSGGTAAVAAPEAERDGVAGVIASYQARFPSLDRVSVGVVEAQGHSLTGCG
jgi:hypothetical protein